MEKKLSAVICAVNSQYIHSSLAPWCLLAGVGEYCTEGIHAEVVEGTINENPADVLKRILACSPQVVGFSCYIWNIGYVRRLVRRVKNELPDTVIVLGGPEVSYNAGEILEDEPQVRFVISGEGEVPFALLLNAIYREESVDGIPGLSFRSEGEVLHANRSVSVKNPPSPYTEKYFSALKGRIAYLETSRGCPFSCSFCLSGFGNARFFDIERAKRDILLLAHSGARTVKLVDRTFNANPDRAAELFGYIIDNYGFTIPKDVCFHFEIAGDLLDDRTLTLLESAPPGLIQFEIGIQSFNEETLAAVNRKTDLEKLKSNIRRLTAKKNIHVHIDLIAGLPKENLQSFVEGFNTAYHLGANMLQLGFLKLLTGSAMQREGGFGRFSENPPYEVLETPWITADELRFLHRAEDALDRLYNSGRFRRTLDYLFGSTGYTPLELFGGFGAYLGMKVEGMSLDDYISEVVEYFCSKTGVKRSILRDTLVCDRLATNPSGRLPTALQVEDTRLGRLRVSLGGGRKGVAILYSENCAVCADYAEKDPLTGEYKLEKKKIYIQ